MDSIRQQIINTIDARLRTIKTANGYETNIGDNVFHWRAVNFEQSDLPLVEYRDMTCTRIDGVNGFHTFNLSVDIEVITASGATTPSQVRKMIADIYKAIGQDTQWGGLAINTELVGDETNVSQADKAIGGAMIRLRLLFRTRVYNPYSQS